MRKRFLAFLTAMPTLVFAQSHDTSEREQVIRMFDALIPKFEVRKGDGLGSDIECVFARKWDQSYRRDADGEPKESFAPRELLTIEQALDPLDRHAEMFCDQTELAVQAQKMAKDRNKNVAIASIGFSYPEFAPDLQAATVYYQRWSQLFVSNRRKLLPVAAMERLKFKKNDGIWSFEVVHLGTMN